MELILSFIAAMIIFCGIIALCIYAPLTMATIIFILAVLVVVIPMISLIAFIIYFVVFDR